MVEPRTTNAAPARAYLLELQAKGVGVRQAARRSRVAPATIYAVRSGRTMKIRQSTAAAILRIPAALAPGQRLNGHQTYEIKRLVRALEKEGYTRKRIAAEIGRPRLRMAKTVTARTAAGIRALWRKTSRIEASP